MPDISVVTPVYGSPDSLSELRDGVDAAMQALGASYELIMIDDRCPKNSWAVIKTLIGKFPEIVGVRLSRNFGQHPAIYAGLRHASGELVVVMDCDLQDDPAEIPKLIEKAREGFDVVRARRTRRKDSVFRKTLSSAFYGTLSFMTGVKHSAEIANFGVYRRKVVDALTSWSEDHRYFPAAAQWIGFKSADIEIEHSKRKHGKTSYNLGKLADLALSIVISFSDKPLRIIALAGIGVSVLSFALSGVYLVTALVGGFSVPGWATIIISLWFLSGVFLFAVGLTGLYVGQAMREAKGRPNYIVDEVVSGQPPAANR